MAVTNAFAVPLNISNAVFSGYEGFVSAGINILENDSARPEARAKALKELAGACESSPLSSVQKNRIESAVIRQYEKTVNTGNQAKARSSVALRSAAFAALCSMARVNPGLSRFPAMAKRAEELASSISAIDMFEVYSDENNIGDRTPYYKPYYIENPGGNRRDMTDGIKSAITEALVLLGRYDKPGFLGGDPVKKGLYCIQATYNNKENELLDKGDGGNKFGLETQNALVEELLLYSKTLPKPIQLRVNVPATNAPTATNAISIPVIQPLGKPYRNLEQVRDAVLLLQSEKNPAIIFQIFSNLKATYKTKPGMARQIMRETAETVRNETAGVAYVRSNDELRAKTVIFDLAVGLLKDVSVYSTVTPRDKSGIIEVLKLIESKSPSQENRVNAAKAVFEINRAMK